MSVILGFILVVGWIALMGWICLSTDPLERVDAAKAYFRARR